jgi:hypothetical protein
VEKGHAIATEARHRLLHRLFLGRNHPRRPGGSFGALPARNRLSRPRRSSRARSRVKPPNLFPFMPPWRSPC